MEEDSEYELLPHKELEFLRNEVADMKKNPLGEKYESPDLISSVHKLTEVIEHMNDIFTSTNKEMMDDFQNHSLHNNFKAISSQNEEIARGILSVAQIVQTQSDLLTKLIDKLDAKPHVEVPKVEDKPVEVPLAGVPNAEAPVMPEASKENMPEAPKMDAPPQNVPPVNPEPPKKGFFGKMF